MNIPLLFFIFLAIAVVSFIIAMVNILTATKKVFDSDMWSLTHKAISIHLIAGLFYVLGGIGAIGFGIAWIVTYLKH